MPLMSEPGMVGSTTVSVMGRAMGAAVLHAAPRARPTQRAMRRLDIGDINGEPLHRERQGWNGFERRKWENSGGSDTSMKGAAWRETPLRQNRAPDGTELTVMSK
jgi:hypothetical protein